MLAFSLAITIYRESAKFYQRFAEFGNGIIGKRRASQFSLVASGIHGVRQGIRIANGLGHRLEIAVARLNGTAVARLNGTA